LLIRVQSFIVSARQARVLLTGGIGAGKSTVGELLRARGALVIDADEIGHSVLEPGGEAFNRVAETWPSVVVDGLIDRQLLADIVFHDPHELQRLESFTHEAIRKRIRRMIEASQERVVVVEVPLLTDFMGKGWIRVVVDADPAIRMERLAERGVDEGDAVRRMAAQPDRLSWRAAADILIDNSGGPAELEGRVAVLWRRLTTQGSETGTEPAHR
jgi:dephospho-CoA kinase